MPPLLASNTAAGEPPVVPILTLLLIAVVVAVASRRLRLPFNIALIAAGMLLNVVPNLPRFDQFELDPTIIFNVLLPVLLFQAALETNISEFRANVGTISALALIGTIGAVFLIGGLMAVTVFAGSPRPLLTGLLVGAILATTDTVSVLSAFKNVRVPARLSAIVEGESLFNDGAALVAFGVIVALLSGGDAGGAPAVFGNVLLVVAGGAAAGAMLGFLAGKLSRQIPDSLTCLMLTTIVAYGTYILAERLHMSGVIATVTAGLVFRGTAWTQELSPATRLAMLSFWEFAGFLVNSVVFLLLGFAIRFDQLWSSNGPILWGLLAIHGARVLTVYPLMQAARPLGAPAPTSWQHVLVFGNIKGAVSAAMALLVGRMVADPSDPTDTRPLDFADHQTILNITFGLVLLTLLSQGMFLSRFLRVLGLGTMARRDIDIQQLQLRLLTARTALRELDRLHEAGLLTSLNYGQLRSRYRLAVAQSEEGLQRAEVDERTGESADRVTAAQRHLLTVEKSAVLDAVRDKIVADEAAAELLQKLDERLLALNRQLDQH